MNSEPRRHDLMLTLVTTAVSRGFFEMPPASPTRRSVRAYHMHESCAVHPGGSRPCVSKMQMSCAVTCASSWLSSEQGTRRMLACATCHLRRPSGLCGSRKVAHGLNTTPCGCLFFCSTTQPCMSTTHVWLTATAYRGQHAVGHMIAVAHG